MKEVHTKGLEKERIRLMKSGELRLLRQVNEYLYDVELWLLNAEVNRNNWKFINLEEHRALFAGTPILIAYINKGAGIGDGHNFELRRDPKTGKDRPSFTAETAERIVGSLSDDPKDIRLEERDGVTWIVGRGTLWKFYAPELVDKITADAAQGRSMSVSIEALIEKFHMEGDVEVEERYTPLGTTILGDHVAPAVKDARVIALGRGGFAELKVRAASYRENQSKKNCKEGGNLSMNKQAVARLAPKFEGYRIIGLSKDEKRVVLADQKGAIFSYTFGEDDQGEVILAKLKAVNLDASVGAPDGEEGLAVDVDEILDHVTNGVRDQAKTIEHLNKQLEEANAAIESMKQAEQKRRVDSVKETLERTMAEIEASEDGDVEDLKEQAKALSEKAEDYAKLEDADGAFCGDQQARKDLMALNGERCMKLAAGRKNAGKKEYVWNRLEQGEDQDDGSIEALLHRMGIE